MKFSWKKEKNAVSIFVEIESKEEGVGYRAEAPYPKIHLKENVALVFTGTMPKRIHPDMLALLCVISFYPFLRKWVTFPEAVSKDFANALHNLKLFQTIDGKYQHVPGCLHVKNIDPELKLFSGGTNLSLSYGGGLDSTATMVLFPEAYVIHEKRTSHPDGTQDFLKDLEHDWVKWKNRTFCIESNNKDLTKEPGWTGWISCASTCVLMATKLNLGAILLGSSMGSSYLSNGKKFYPVHKSHPNQWFRFFKEVGLDIFSPIAGLSEIALANVLRQTYPKWLEEDVLTYCLKKNGRNCHKCFKCFRREMVIACILDDISKVKWDQYRQPKILKILDQIPKKGGPSLHWSFMILGKKFNETDSTKWLSEYGRQLKNRSCQESEKWINKYYQKSLGLVPEEYHGLCNSRIKKYILPLECELEKYIESWTTLS